MKHDPSYANELAKEFLRDQFHNGTLDVTSSYEQLAGFCQIFVGEMECLIAIDNDRSLTEAEKIKLIKIARPTKETADHYRAWLDRALNGANH